MNVDLRGLGLSLLPWTRSLTHAVFLQASASITLLLPRRLGANAACLCCRTRSAGRAPSGTATRLWSVHLNSTLLSANNRLGLFCEIVAASGRIPLSHDAHAAESKDDVVIGETSKLTASLAEFSTGISRNSARFGAYLLGCGQGGISPDS
jgi:hypothetical protein